MPERDELDVLLDSALAGYADPGVHSGLEERVLAALDAGPAKRAVVAKPRRHWLPWAVTIPVAACFLVWLLMGRKAHSPSIQPQIALRPNLSSGAPQRPRLATTEHPSGAKARRKPGAMSARLKSCLVTKPQSQLVPSGGACASGEQTVPTEADVVQAVLPKLDVFPTPRPLTEQERGLALFAQRAQAPVRKALVEAQQEDDAPLHIATIHIPPIALPSQTPP